MLANHDPVFQELQSSMGALTACFPVNTPKAAERLATTEQSVVISCIKLLESDTCIITSSQARLSVRSSRLNNSFGLTQAAKFSAWVFDKENSVSSLTPRAVVSHVYSGAARQL